MSNKLPSINIWLDESKVTVLVVCDACGWRHLCFDKQEAWFVHKAHRIETHPNTLSTLELQYYRDRKKENGMQ